MFNPSLLIARVMTVFPAVIAHNQRIKDARLKMADSHVQYLPVMDDKTLVGMLSAEDILTLEALPGIESDELLVSAAMTTPVITCTVDTSVNDAIQQMVDAKIGAIVVIDDDQLKGLFTSKDAMKLVNKVIGQR